LYLLKRLEGEYGLNLAAAHLDHGIRAASSKDREFCRELCRELKVRYYSRRVDIGRLAKKKKANIEETGRKERYAYFDSLGEKYGYKKIATGHTLDDNAETVLFNLIRGSGLRGLSGITPKRGKIIRPLVETRKTDLIKWLKENKIKYRIDPTNRSLKYSRNRIRKKILPRMEEINPDIVKSLSRFSRIVSEDVELIDKAGVLLYEKALIVAGKSKIVLDLRKLGRYDESLVKKVVVEAFFRLMKARKSPAFELLSRAGETISGKSGGKSPLGNGIWVEKSQNRVLISKISEGPKGETILKVPGITEIEGYDRRLKAEILKKAEIGSLKTKPSVALLDNSRVNNPAVRFWKRGDRIRPLGMKGTRLLSDLFTDKKVPSFERGNIPLVVSEGKIAWIAGMTVSDEFKVKGNTAEVLRIELCAR
jgi:tRNA(Ile)-lysidine synthase